MLTRKKVSVALVLILAMLAAAACGSSGGSPSPGTSASGNDPSGEGAQEVAAEPDKVRFAYFPAFHTMVVFVAEQGGFFEKQNIEVDMIYTDRGSLQTQMLIANETDIATGDLTSIAVANSQNRNLLHIFPTSQHMSMNFVASNESLERLGVGKDDPLEAKLEALGKMRIGITGPNAPTDIYTRFLLDQGGYDPKDVEIIALSNAGNLMAALKSGQIDGFMLTPPSPNQPELEGYGTVLIKSSAGEVPELANYPYQGITVRKAWAEANPEVASRFVKALLEASEFIKNQPEEATVHLKAYFEEMADESIEAGMADMIPALPTDGLMTEDFVQHYLELNKELGILELEELPSSADGELWTNDYVLQAAE
ncbi:ABC transporter substrate-binding protein [Xylanibacillus composti]|uniref:ABC transporter substrate-binding protein n=1 Tax=Xylanibacillus composti TaxID=1572762 RepID=A0A8J4H5C1_9BACL|nr:ABC transporter substrate-binding protein [Xylanibacillus composti]MDT9726474.1 ABC transporter substrate-binding protein [Xylanibacillus composti]GIQ69956.1 ABC transporter substrate-binding protein [Xylanibacillus composti]